MESKKNVKVEINHLRANFFLFGMVISLLVILGAFSYTKYERKQEKVGPLVYEEKVEVMENTEQKKTPPPPPPPPVLQIVADEVVIPDDAPDIIDTDDDQETKVTAPVEPKNDEPEATDDILEYYEVQKQAEFKGGEEGLQRFIRENLVYPEMAIHNELEGKILVLFVVWKDGSIRDITVFNPRKGYELLEAEAKRVVERMQGQGLWSPAEQRDRKVPQRFKLPIVFQL